MKKALVFLVVSMLVSFIATAQKLKNIDQISHFHEGLAAIEKGDQWGFINTEGEIVVDFRSDLVTGSICDMECCVTKPNTSFPVFKNERALIKKVQDGITHYGYIDVSGEIVIEPNFINATCFNLGKAIVLKKYKENLGKNNVLGKNMVSYGYNEVVIDSKGVVIMHLAGPSNLLYSKDKLKTPPSIQSRILNNNLIAIKAENNTWELRTIKK